jgi:hypothetical protein
LFGSVWSFVQVPLQQSGLFGSLQPGVGGVPLQQAVAAMQAVPQSLKPGEGQTHCPF